ncbi:copper chaperone for superoxide dismutase [Onthophagus taurus]|uniref:copper chaperone for superoxide dismutase n=1 Tax=Onthophagus taurus TaxID=166361 RepID=UPI0039BE2EA4
MSSITKIEFAVKMTCEKCVEAVQNSFRNESRVQLVDINLKANRVVVATDLPTEQVQQILEKSGRKVVVKGHAGQQSAVAILHVGLQNIKGVVRFIQLSNSCIIDGTIDGLSPGIYNLAIHECGDISKDCESVGDCFEMANSIDPNRKYGDLGIITADKNGRASFRIEDHIIEVPNLIGRSLVLLESNSKNRLVCGIIARSSGLFENPKTICACDGISIWDERILTKSGL